MTIHGPSECSGGPFLMKAAGGKGPSGMGHYHGIEGFKTFSHARGVYKQTRIEAMLKLMRPPYGKLFDQILSSRIKK